MELENTLQGFNRLSGLRINYSKSTLYSIDNPDNTKREEDCFKVTKNLFLLGIEIGRNEQQRETTNITQRVNNIKVIFTRWKQRNLSLIGKILILRTYALYHR